MNAHQRGTLEIGQNPTASCWSCACSDQHEGVMSQTPTTSVPSKIITHSRPFSGKKMDPDGGSNLEMRQAGGRPRRVITRSNLVQDVPWGTFART